MKKSKTLRQKLEYNRQYGQTILNEKITNLLHKMNKQNYKLIHQNTNGFIKKTKQKYGIKNISKIERIYIQTINKLKQN
tara:strand:+ start:419 stop:655 length:237 start_codon:yes stop_codon:yes gene_type:complete